MTKANVGRPEKPKKSKRKSKRERTRRRILERAGHLFCQQGYDAVTMQEIADAVDISKTTIYYSHYRAKEDLFAAILHDESEKFLRQLESLHETPQTPQNALDALIHVTFDALGEGVHFWNLLLSSISDATVKDVVARELGSARERFLAAITRIFEQIGTGDARAHALLFFTAFQGLLFQNYFLPGVVKKREVVHALVDAFPLKDEDQHVVDKILELYESD